MDESAWITSTDPTAMLAHARGMGLGPGQPFASDRRLRLFACACCRASWHLFGNSARRAIGLAEAHADGKVSIGQVQAACEIIPPAGGALSAIAHNEVRMLCWQADIVAMRIADPGHAIPPEQKAALLREIVGNPLRPVVLPAVRVPCPDCPEGEPDENCDDCGGSGWVSESCPWITPPVLAIARTIYEERRFEDGAVLADALEEVGCDNDDLLMHLRGREKCRDCHHDFPDSEFGGGGGSYWCPTCGGTQDSYRGDGWAKLPIAHARGCWALDLILGKS